MYYFRFISLSIPAFVFAFSFAFAFALYFIQKVTNIRVESSLAVFDCMYVSARTLQCSCICVYVCIYMCVYVYMECVGQHSNDWSTVGSQSSLRPYAFLIINQQAAAAVTSQNGNVAGLHIHTHPLSHTHTHYTTVYHSRPARTLLGFACLRAF